MKLFYVTFWVGDSTKRAVIGQIGTQFSYTEIASSCHYGVFNADMYEPSTYRSNYNTRSRVFRSATTPAEVVENFLQADHKSVVVTPFTSEQRKFLRTTGLDMYKEILDAFYMSCDNARSNQIYHHLRLMVNKCRADSYFTFHGQHVYPARYMQIRQLYKELGELVAQAIYDNDTTPVDEFLIQRCGISGVDNVALYENINNNLSLGLTHCDCGHLEQNDQTHDVGRRGADTWCNQCFEEDAVFVENRDEYWPRDDAFYHESDGLYYSYEEEEIDEDDDNNQDTDLLMSYSTNVLNFLSKDNNIISSAHGDFLMGIEFEMETKDDFSVNDAVEDVRSQLGESYCVCKSDGSLGCFGLEIVTAPRGLAEHIRKFKGWEVNSSYRAWDTKRCGLHVHIDSRAFTQMTLGKFIMLINSETNVDFIRKIAGRHPNKDDQARSYCASEFQEVLINPKKATKDKSHERYRMVNLQNLGSAESKRLTSTNAYGGRYNTVELRIFRASLNKMRMLAQIEFSHACVCFCRVASWRDLNQASFIKWLKTVSSQYPNLADWYGVRRRNTKVTAESQCRDTVESV